MSHNPELPITSWLPITRKEIEKRGWNDVDIVIISGDAYVDHPSFGHAVIGRILEREGYKVAIIPQPNWRDDLRDFKKFGKPRLFFGISGGCMDSMVNHYTANKRLRSDDAYTPGGKASFRPDYAVTVYSNILKTLYPETPVIIGGIEASMRRFSHYDYWSDSYKPSILIDSKADMLVYGMGEKAITEIANRLNEGKDISEITDIPQTAFLNDNNKSKITLKDNNSKILKLASYEECLTDKSLDAKNFAIFEQQSNRSDGALIIQDHGNSTLVVNPSYPITEEKELDSVYDLPFTRLPHPKYKDRGAIPAYEMIRHSVTLHRGCFGGCSFCTISAHQGKDIASRSEESILKEVTQISNMPDFKGYISDLGGPSANMYKMKGKDLKRCGICMRPSCIYPSICSNLCYNHRPLIELYRKASKIKGIKKIFIGSGIRYDLLKAKVAEDDKKYGLSEYLEEVIKNHVSGRLKVAPEHTSDKVLDIMRKPTFKLFVELKKKFDEICRKNSINQQLIPYFISSHPGCGVIEMAELAVATKELGYRLEQVQDFTPTPMTLSTVMYYTGIDPYTMKPVFVARSREERAEQNAMFFWYKNENQMLLRKALQKFNRTDLLKKLSPPQQGANNRRR